MTEDFLHYIWQHRLYVADNSFTVEGEAVEILQTGQRNMHAGPDFVNARVRIDNMVWAGCIELHLNSSDWARHGHHIDPAYNNVVLHVVYRYDSDTYNAHSQKIPIMELHFDNRYYENYFRLADSKVHIVCSGELNRMGSANFESWLSRLAVERLEQKAEVIMRMYAATNNNWEETFYRQLARSFGFALNALPFELLAQSLPLNILLKHKDNLLQIEALLFGQAGMLVDDLITDVYYVELRKEYLYLQKKYGLKPVEKFLWKFLRLRPVNFPTLRIAQLASLIYCNEHLFSQITTTPSVDMFERLFRLQASTYWDRHYVFGKESSKRSKSFGRSSIHSVLINTVVPFLFVYGKSRSNDSLSARAITLLENLPAEKNAILIQWKALGVNTHDAFTSQALLQLNNEYCLPKRCLQCAIGNRIVRNSA